MLRLQGVRGKMAQAKDGEWNVTFTFPMDAKDTIMELSMMPERLLNITIDEEPVITYGGTKAE